MRVSGTYLSDQNALKTGTTVLQRRLTGQNDIKSRRSGDEQTAG
jgi:hypothetical protein